MTDDNRQLERTLMGSDDAMVWATEFCRIFDGHMITNVEGEHWHTVDAGSMVTWFANCMQVAVSQYERRKLRDKELIEVTDGVDDGTREAFVAGFDDGRTRPTDLDDRTA